MKKFIRDIIVIFIPVMLGGCVNFHGTDKSVWSGGMWVIPVVIGLGTIIFSFLAYKQSIGGTIEYKKNGFAWDLVETNEKIPIYKVPYFYFAIGTIVINFMVILFTVLEA